MRFLIVTLVVALAASSSLAAENELSSAEKLAGWKLLFNGKDLTGLTCPH